MFGGGALPSRIAATAAFDVAAFDVAAFDVEGIARSERDIVVHVAVAGAGRYRAARRGA
jgi:hypothetical protein